MPLYEYECAAHGTFEAMRPLAEYQLPHACPECGEQSARVVTTVNLGLVPTTTRKAHQRNEKSAHAPGSTRERHGKGCSCCSGDQRKRSNAVTTAGGAKTFPSKRPWMISH
jgi:putative FmdB family regulatory protein